MEIILIALVLTAALLGVFGVGVFVHWLDVKGYEKTAAILTLFIGCLLIAFLIKN